MSVNNENPMMDTVAQLEDMEREICNLPLVFAEMFKDEINACEEQDMYLGVKKIIRKYSGDRTALSIINEFTSAISGGASLQEILMITKDEAADPTMASRMTVDESCRVEEHDER